MHKQQAGVLNVQPILAPKQLGPAVDALELYPKQEKFSVQTVVFFLAQGNLVDQLHQVPLVSSQSTQEAPQIALAIWSEITVSSVSLLLKRLVEIHCS